MNKGFVYLVGAGPGDTDLITKAGYELIQKCEVLIYDRLISPKLVDLVDSKCEKIYVGKTVGNHAIKQNEINDIIVAKALENKFVVRLKGGDPFVFGRGGEEILELQKHNIPYKVIPGVTSAIAGLAYAGIPITHRGKSRGFHVITGHSNDDSSSIPNNLDVLAKLDETLVFLMGFSNLDKIVEGLISGGKNINTPVAIVSNATTESQKEVRGTLRDIVKTVEHSTLKAPALIVIGDVASLDFRDKNNVLSGINIGITGTSDLVAKQKKFFELYGANVFEVCNFDVAEVPNKTFEEDIRNISKFKWLVFTSANSVKTFFKKFFELEIDLRNLALVKFAVVGSGTESVLNSYGFKADLMPKEFSAKHLGNELVKVVREGERLLIPYAKNHTNDLTEILLSNNVEFSKQIVYEIVLSELQDFDFNSLDFITFASTKGVQEFFSNSKQGLSNECKVVCIGDLTKEELKIQGIDAFKTETADVEGLVNTIVNLRGAK